MPEASACSSSLVVCVAVRSTRIGPTERVPRDERDRLFRRRRPAPGRCRERTPPLLGRGELDQPSVAETVMLEDESAPVDEPDDAKGGAGPPDARDQAREHAPDLPEAEQDDLHPLGPTDRAAADPGELKGGVDAALRLGRPIAVDHDRNVQLARSLGDGDHVDPARREGGEHARGHARRARHAEPHHRDRRDAVADLDAVDLPALDLVAKLVQQRRPRLPRRGVGHAEADRVLRRRLGDERNRDAPLLQGGEGARRDARDAEHAVAGHRDQRLMGRGGERLHRQLRRRHPLGDLGAARGGVGERAHVQRDLASGERDQRARVQHLGPVVRQLRGLARVQGRDHARVGDDPGIGREQAGHVLPQRDSARTERAGEQGGGEIGAAAARAW